MTALLIIALFALLALAFVLICMVAGMCVNLTVAAKVLGKALEETTAAKKEHEEMKQAYVDAAQYYQAVCAAFRGGEKAH